jgi:protein-disulfide isomerase
MRKTCILFLFAVLLSPLAAPAFAQADDESMASGDAARKARILANLEFNIPQLAQANPSIGSIGPSGIAGLEEGTLIINGQPRPFLVTSDDKKFWLLASEPLDVSRDTAEIEAEQARKDQEREQTLAGITEGQPVRGNPDAPVTIVEFSDFQCPYCARGFQTVEQLLEKYPQDVKFVFQHFPLTQIHPWAKPAAIAAECASSQSPEAFWTLHDAFFSNQGDFNPGNVVEKGKTILADSGIDLGQWETCAGDQSSEAHKAAEAAVDAEQSKGQELGVSGTPGFFVNGQFLNGAQPITAFEPLIEKAKKNGMSEAQGMGE